MPTLRQALRNTKPHLPTALYFDILMAMRNFELAQTEPSIVFDQRASLIGTFDVALRVLFSSGISQNQYDEVEQAFVKYLDKDGEIELSLST